MQPEETFSFNPVVAWIIFIAIIAGIGFGIYKFTVGNTTNQFLSEKTMNNELVTVVVDTSLGMIELELWHDKAPLTVENFVKLAKSGFYDGTKFHRVIPNFMIQAGDPNTKTDNVNTYGTGGPGYQFNDEINDVKLVRGVLAMANAGPNTNGSQFFIVTSVATPWLDGKHTAFGKVVKGMEVVDAIENVKTVAGYDRPVEPVVIKSVTVK